MIDINLAFLLPSQRNVFKLLTWQDILSRGEFIYLMITKEELYLLKKNNNKTIESANWVFMFIITTQTKEN